MTIFPTLSFVSGVHIYVELDAMVVLYHHFLGIEPKNGGVLSTALIFYGVLILITLAFFISSYIHSVILVMLEICTLVIIIIGGR